MSYTTGTLVRALAGRERNELFIVAGQSDGFPLLVNGKGRKLENPKRKNPRHLCPVETAGFDHPVIRKLKEGTPVTDRELRKALAAFKEGITLG